ncbi:MAG: hypothetical protein AAGA53_12500 [Pseudomonadota bacterium]
MAIEEQIASRPAEDGFQAYYTEKIWHLIPAVYRDQDPKTHSPNALRGLVEVLGEAIADTRRGVDRLWADSNIEDCDDWVIPYIGELLGTRLISEQNAAGRRTDVANTIKYRRMAGTLALLSLLAEDIAGWDAIPQEAFKRLFRNWHSLDCPPSIGAISETPQHGFARLNNRRVGEAAYGPFDDVSHFPDFRQLRGRHGRYNIPKVNLHVFRQSAYPLENTTPHIFGGGRYTLDPSGRDIQLFIPGVPANDGCKTGKEWQIRQPLTCLLYNDGRYDLDRSVLNEVGLAELLPLDGQTFRTLADLILRATNLKQQEAGDETEELSIAEGLALITGALRETSNRGHFFKDSVIELAYGPSPEASLTSGQQFGGNLSDWVLDVPTAEDWVEGLVDPSNGRFLDTNPDRDLHVRRYYEGHFWPVGAGSHERSADLSQDAEIWNAPGVVDAGLHLPLTSFTFPTNGIHSIADSRTYQITANADLTLTDDLVLQANNRQRPYIRMEATPQDESARFVVDGPDGANLTLDGLWLGIIHENQTTEPIVSAQPRAADIVLAGNFGSVTLRNMTLDPGGQRAQIIADEVFVLPFVRLRIEGTVDQITIDRCVTGPIEEVTGAYNLCGAARICIFDSIVISQNEVPAILGLYTTLEMARTTVIGNIETARYFIEDSLIEGTLVAQDPQGSCIRYSAAHEHPVAGLANAYRSVSFPDGLPNGLFISRRFGDPSFLQLSELAPQTIRRGAENTSEMGAYNRALDPIKRDDLIYKLSEFTAINTITQLVFET